MSDKKKTALAVIGGGPGGYAAAFMAADLGIEVSLIDVEENPGGTCLYRGCIPSKALLHAARVINEAREARDWGITFGEPEIDLDKLRASTNEVVAKMTEGLGQLCKARKIDYIQGRASFEDSNTLAISKMDGTVEMLSFEHAVISAGSRPALFGQPIDSPHIMNSTNALKLADIPKTLLVIGGGYIGLELGTVYATLGSRVTVVEMTSGLLPGVDRDLLKPLAKRLEGLFEEILLETRVTDMKDTRKGMKISLEGSAVKKPVSTFDKVLVCVGRKPNASGLNLKSTKVVVNKQGFIEVDAQRRTADPSIYAIGDIVGGAMLAHKASHEGRVAAEAIAGRKVAFEPQAIPAVVFTDPEIAWCGLTEDQATRSERDIRISRFPWAASGRAVSIHRSEGLTKLIFDAETDRLLGMGISGSGAGELIAEGVLALEMGASASDLDLTIHPHPTLSETVMESAAALFGQATHFYAPKKKGRA